MSELRHFREFLWTTALERAVASLEELGGARELCQDLALGPLSNVLQLALIITELGCLWAEEAACGSGAALQMMQDVLSHGAEDLRLVLCLVEELQDSAQYSRTVLAGDCL